MLNFKSYLEEMYKNLTAGELLKPGRETRPLVIIDKIENGKPFLTMTGDEVILKHNQDEVNAFKAAIDSRDSKALNGMKFVGMNGRTYQLNSFAKTGEFGGKGKGSGLKVEDAALNLFKSQFTAELQKSEVPYLWITIGNRTEKVADIVSTPGSPKADFHMLDPDGKEVFWLSHKKGKKANDFQQYGGMTEVKDSAEIQQFVKDVQSKLEDPNKFPMKTAFYREVKSKDLINKTLFGKDYTGGVATSRQNIDVLYQGPMNLKSLGREIKNVPVYTITSNHTIVRGEYPSGDYLPYLYVRPEQIQNQFKIKGARFFIVSKLTAIKNVNAKEI
jgi:hypothetical protein